MYLNLHPEACDEEVVIAHVEELGPISYDDLISVTGMTKANVDRELTQLVKRKQINYRNRIVSIVGE